MDIGYFMNKDSDSEQPTIYISDTLANGSGFSKNLFDNNLFSDNKLLSFINGLLEKNAVQIRATCV